MTSASRRKLWSSVATFATAAMLYAGDAGLQLVGENFRISQNATIDLADIFVAYNSTASEYRVAWSDILRESNRDIYSQRVSAAGELVGDELAIIEETWTNIDPRLAYNPVADNYLVTWRFQGELSDTPGFNHTFGGIYATDGVLGLTLDENGQILGDPLVIADGTGAYSSMPRAIANTSEGGFLVIWTDGRNAEENRVELYGQLVGSEPGPLGDLDGDVDLSDLATLLGYYRAGM